MRGLGPVGDILPAHPSTLQLLQVYPLESLHECPVSCPTAHHSASLRLTPACKYLRVNPLTRTPQPLQDGSRQINTIPLVPLQSPSQTCPGAFCTAPQRVPEGLSPTASGRDHSRAHPVFTGFPVFPPWESLSQLNHLHTGPRQALLSAEAPIRALPGAQHQGSWESSLLPLLFPQDSRVLL